MDFKYDVILSFAGEDRDYVHRVAQTLLDNGIKVFYDKFEEVDLWGKDLGVHFDYVYRKGGHYFVPFISANYKKKIWTNYEIKTAIARAIETNSEYILPAKFDDTEINGIRPTLSFIDLRKYSPEEFAHIIIKKLDKEPTVPLPEKNIDNNGKIYLAVKTLINGNQEMSGVAIGVTMTNIVKEYRYFNEPYFTLSNSFEGKADTFYLIDKLIRVDFPKKLEYGEVCSVDYLLNPRSVPEMWEKIQTDTLVQAIVTTTVEEIYKSNQIPVSEIIKSFNGSNSYYGIHR